MEDKLKEKILTSYKYNPETGDIVGPSGKIIVRRNSHGYIRAVAIVEKAPIDILGHHIAWLLYYGEWPEKQVDHINGVRYDNRIANLREATQRENLANSKSHRAGKLLGTQKLPSGRYRSQILHHNKLVQLGTYDTELEAHLAFLVYQSENNIA